MKLLILSDSHREMEYMRDAVRRERPDAVIHLGDLVPDADRLAEEFPGLPVLSVRGNCDFSQPPRAEELLRTFEGVKIFGVHGHRYRVKQTLLPVEMAARQNGSSGIRTAPTANIITACGCSTPARAAAARRATAWCRSKTEQ